MKLTIREDVFDCLSAYVASAALGTAIELGLFWLLAEQPLDAPGVAGALNIPIKRCRYWLQLLDSMGLIEHTASGYALPVWRALPFMMLCLATLSSLLPWNR